MKKMRWLAVVAALILAAPVLAPSSVDARAGGGTSKGSRGDRTNDAPSATPTAPTAKPMERSAKPADKPAAPAAAPATAAKPGGFFSRNPFLSGLMGGMLGAGLFGMLFGGGFGAGLGGAAGFLGLLLQVALIGGLAYLAVRLFRGWSANRAQPAGAMGSAGLARGYDAPARMADAPLQRSSIPSSGVPSTGGGVGLGGMLAGGGVAATGASSPIAIVAEDYQAFEALLGKVQAAYSKGDLAGLRTLATPEMVGYFSEELSANASRGVENKVDAVKLEQGDLSEAWREAGLDYATVAMRFSMIDVTRRIADGTIVEGNPTTRVEATEIWTFLRSRDGQWLVSAIQQA